VTANPPSADDLAPVAEAVYTLAAVVFSIVERQPADLAARRVVHIRHEVRHAIAEWAPPPGSYRARDLRSEP
jgi:hypothetical protein